MALVQVITYPDLPLAIYREIAAHLRQVKGVQVFLTPQTSLTFDYQKSQVGTLHLTYPSVVEPTQEEEIRAILAHYGAYEIIEVPQEGQ